MDPRNPKPKSLGDNVAVCRECGRSARKIKDIRHKKYCGWRLIEPPKGGR